MLKSRKSSHRCASSGLHEPQQSFLLVLHIVNEYAYVGFTEDASGNKPSQDEWLIKMIDKCCRRAVRADVSDAKTRRVKHKYRLQTTSTFT